MRWIALNLLQNTLKLKGDYFLPFSTAQAETCPTIASEHQSKYLDASKTQLTAILSYRNVRYQLWEHFFQLSKTRFQVNVNDRSWFGIHTSMLIPVIQVSRGGGSHPGTRVIIVKIEGGRVRRFSKSTFSIYCLLQNGLKIWPWAGGVAGTRLLPGTFS